MLLLSGKVQIIFIVIFNGHVTGLGKIKLLFITAFDIHLIIGLGKV
jgi:hypothetical protein